MINGLKLSFIGKTFGVITVLLLTFFTFGCGNDNSEGDIIESTENNKTAEHSEVIKLSDDVIKELGIELKEVTSGVIRNHIDLTGEIVTEPSRIAHIVPRFEGIVKEVFKTVGDKVKKGDLLAVIESNESLTEYNVKSLIDGTIIEMHMTQGELIGTETHAFTVADLDKVWAILTIYQRDINKIKVGQRVTVSVGFHQNEESAVISYVSPVVDEATRTATARVILNNTSGKWVPGMFVKAKVIVSEQKAKMVVEKSALQTLEHKTVVFVKYKEGFKAQRVKIGKENDENVEIISGLKPGQKYASEGSFTLKAETLKESFGGGHGH